MAQFWRSFCLNRAQNQVILAAVFNFQLKAFTIAIGFVFGKDSILATKLWDFVVNVDGKHSIIYKNRMAIDDTFAAKVLWLVDCFTQLFLEDCHKCNDQEDVNQRY